MFKIIIRKSNRVIKRYKYSSYEAAIEALDDIEYRFGDEYTIEFKSKLRAV